MARWNSIEEAAIDWLGRNSVVLLRVSLGVVFLWFGALKLIPGGSPAEELAGRTIQALTFGLVKPEASLPLLAVWECLIGIGLVTGWRLRTTILLLLIQMAGTLSPLILFTRETFSVFPFAPTLEGQYILKNLVLISAALAIAGTLPRREAIVAGAFGTPVGS